MTVDLTNLHLNLQTINTIHQFPGSCPTDDSRYKLISSAALSLNRCYYLELDYKNYEDAKTNCASKFSSGGKLFEPLSLEINYLVWEEFKAQCIY